MKWHLLVRENLPCYIRCSLSLPSKQWLSWFSWQTNGKRRKGEPGRRKPKGNGVKAKVKRKKRDNKSESSCSVGKQFSFCDWGRLLAVSDWLGLALALFFRWPLCNCTCVQTHFFQKGRGLSRLCGVQVMYLCSSIKHCSPRVLQSADLINKFHRTSRQQRPAAARARVDYRGWGEQNMKGVWGEGWALGGKKNEHQLLKECFKFRIIYRS